MQGSDASAFGLVLLLLPLELPPPFLCLAFLLFLLLLSEPFGLLLALGGGFRLPVSSSVAFGMVGSGATVGGGAVRCASPRPGYARGNRPQCTR